MPSAFETISSRFVQIASPSSTTALPSQISAYRSISRRRRSSSNTISSSAPLAAIAKTWSFTCTSDPPLRGDWSLGACLRHRPLAEEPDEDRQQHLDHVVDRLAGGDRRAAVAARVHPHRHLLHAKAVGIHHQDRLHLRVVVRVIAGEQLDRAPVAETKAGG